MAGWKDRSYFYQISVEDNKLFLFEIVFFFTKLRRNQSRNIYDLDNSVVICWLILGTKKIVFPALFIALFSIFGSTVCREIQYYYIHPTNMYKRWGKICGLFTWLKMALFGLKMTPFYWLVFLFRSPKNVL